MFGHDTIPGLFRAHARRFEAEFLEDMGVLGCREADVFTRVSEYMPEIIAYITRILHAGFAYTASDGAVGGVYFDTEAYRCSPSACPSHTAWGNQDKKQKEIGLS